MPKTIIDAIRGAKVHAWLFIPMLCIGACAPAWGQNWVGILKNTPAESFNDEDLQLLIDAARKALNDTPDGQVVGWENPKTGNRGDLAVLKSFKWKEHPCRSIRVSNQAGARKSSNVLNLCRVEDKWRQVSEAQLKK